MFTPLYTRTGVLSRTQIGAFCVDLTTERQLAGVERLDRKYVHRS